MTAAVVVTMALLGGCTRDVAIPDPQPSGRGVDLCRALMTALPAVVADQRRRTVQPGQFAAAWGDPTITLKCGVTKPPALGPASPCAEVNGVGWFAEEGTGGYLFTTIGRPVFVQVGVPSAYAPEANALVDLATAVQASVPVDQPCV